MDYIDNCPIGNYTCTGCNYLSTCGCMHPNKNKLKEYFIEIPFGARDSETWGWEYTIPDDMEATIKDGKIIVRKKKSEDEKIRKEMFDFFCQFEDKTLRGVDISSWISWLEKQGEQKSKKVSIWKHWKDGIAGNGEGEPMFLIKNHNTYSLSSCLAFECDYIELSELDKLMLEKQGEQKSTIDIQNLTWEDIEKIEDFIDLVRHENPNGIGAKNFYTDVLERFLDEKQVKQKPINDTDEEIVEVLKNTSILDMVEPKFKVGDWVVRGNIKAQILDVQEQYYVGIDTNGNDFTSSRFLSDDKIHLWTIQDAKDGDVLQLGDVTVIFKEFIGNEDCKCYCSVCNGVFKVPTKDESYGTTNSIPATKEQRDLLFQKMKEAGYEWDDEKKELKIIDWSKHIKYEPNSPSITKEKPTEWSEEDAINIKSAIKNYYGEEYAETLCALIDSLKPQSHWKPRDEQIYYLSWIANIKLGDGIVEQEVSKHLNELCEDLKKLKGE